jgi:hypothetical protein
MGGVRRVIATSAAPELGPEVGALDLIVLADFAPGLVGYGAGNVNL